MTQEDEDDTNYLLLTPSQLVCPVVSGIFTISITFNSLNNSYICIILQDPFLDDRKGDDQLVSFDG